MCSRAGAAAQDLVFWPLRVNLDRRGGTKSGYRAPRGVQVLAQNCAEPWTVPDEPPGHVGKAFGSLYAKSRPLEPLELELKIRMSDHRTRIRFLVRRNWDFFVHFAPLTVWPRREARLESGITLQAPPQFSAPQVTASWQEESAWKLSLFCSLGPWSKSNSWSWSRSDSRNVSRIRIHS